MHPPFKELPDTPSGYQWVRSEMEFIFSHYVYALESDASWYGFDRGFNRPSGDGSERAVICLYENQYVAGEAVRAGLRGNEPNANCKMEEFLWGFLYGNEGVTMQGSGKSDVTHPGLWISFQGPRWGGTGWNQSNEYYNDYEKVIFAKNARGLDLYTDVAADRNYKINGYKLRKGSILYAPGLRQTPGQGVLRINDSGGGIRKAILD